MDLSAIDFSKLSYQQAIATLRQANTDGNTLTLSQLKQLIDAPGVAARVPGSTSTLLYSGPLEFGRPTQSGALAQQIAQGSGGKIAIIDNTDVGRLVFQNSDFETAVSNYARTLVPSPPTGVTYLDIAKSIISGNNDGKVKVDSQIISVANGPLINEPNFKSLSDIASSRFVREAEGAVASLTGYGSVDRVNARTEIKEVISNTKITSYDGVAHSAIVDRFDHIRSQTGSDVAYSQIWKDFNAKSDADYLAHRGNISSGSFADFMKGKGISIPEIPNGDRLLSDVEPGFLARLSSNGGDIIKGIAKSGPWLKTVSLLGPIGDVIEASIAVVSSYDAYQSGDAQGAAIKIGAFLGSFSGGILGGAAGVALVGAIGLSGPIGLGVVAALSIGGGVGGEALTRWAQENLESLFGGTGNWLHNLESQWGLSLQPPRDPLILDLGPVGIHLTSMAASGVYFDMDNDGVKERTGWLTAEDGYLAIDENNNGIIDGVGELVGDPGRSGFAELKSYDSNSDGQINASDAIWSKLRVWRDLDGDGTTDAGELQTLAANGVASLSTDFTTVNFTASENLVHEQGFYQTTGGEQRRVIDAWMITDSVNTQGGTGAVSAAAAALPNIRGYGALDNLHQAMTANASLLLMVQQLAKLPKTQFGEMEARVESIMMAWAKASGIDPASRGGFFDARKLAVLEAVTGTPWVQQGTNPPVTNPPSWAVTNLDRAYDLLIDQFTARFLIVGPLADVLSNVLYSTAADRVLGLQPFDAYVDAIDSATPADAAARVFYWAESLKALRSLGESNGMQSYQVDQALRSALSQYGLDGVISQLGGTVDDRRSNAIGISENFQQIHIVMLGSGADSVSLSGGGVALGGSGNDGLRAGNYASVTLYGEGGNDALQGGSGTDYLDGGAGIDWLDGGDASDTYVIDNVADVIIERAGTEGGSADEIRSTISVVLADGIEHLTLLGSAAINGTGNNASNRMVGNSARNILLGGKGDDTYLIGTTDGVAEKVGEGQDTIEVDGTYRLPENIEILRISGTGDFNATGNSGNNSIWGNAGNNVIDPYGGSYNDLHGGAGNDIYWLRSSGDTAYENADEGHDLVYSYVNASLNNNIEDLSLVGDADIDARGNNLANRIRGNLGNNRIDGGDGVDVMDGGSGNDSYRVEQVGDRTLELSNGGFDTVTTTLSTYALEINLERLENANYSVGFTAFGNAMDNEIVGANGASDVIYGRTGNDDLFGGSGDYADTLYGEDGNDTLDGGSGADLMVGGAGDDFYEVENVDDKVVELANGGNDTIRVRTSVFNLATSIENVVVAEGGNWDVNGNVSANRLTGNDWSNVLDGQTGADTMAGARGNDIYVVDQSGDRVIEGLNEGEDLVKSFVDFALGDHIEHLTLLGSTARYGRGNEQNNAIVGNVANNILIGGGGYDSLTGGAGRDTFKFLDYDGTYDRILDFELGANGDTIDVSKLCRSIGYTGSDPFADGLFRINNYSDHVEIDINRNWGKTSSASWSTLGIVQGIGLTGDALRSAGSVIWNSTQNVAPLLPNGIPNQFLNIGDRLQLVLGSNVAIDLDSTSLTWSAAVVALGGNLGALPNWLAFNPFVPALYGTVTPTANDTKVRLTVSDERGASTYVDVAIEIFRPDLGDQNLTGTSASETFNPGVGDDNVGAGAGNDTVIFSADKTPGETTDGDDILNGGEGIDTLNYAATTAAVNINLFRGVATGSSIGNDEVRGFENVVGSAFADTIIGWSEDNVLAGGAGGDILNGNGGIDRASYFSSASGVTVSLATGAGSAGDALGDKLLGIENIEGSARGNDVLSGDAGANWLIGHGGDDVLNGGSGADQLDGGAGSDRLSYVGSSARVIVNLATSTASGGDADGDKVSGFENVEGSSYNDVLMGDSAVNWLIGHSGDDALLGAGGADILTGGGGRDVIVLRALSEGSDRVTDYVVADDTIRIDTATFGGGLSAGMNLATTGRFAANTLGASTAAVGQFLYDTNDGLLYWDSDGTGVQARVLLAKFDNLAVLTASEFLLV